MERKWLTWNVRGLGKAEKRRAVKDLLKKAQPEVVLLQETKLNHTREKTMRNFASAMQYEMEFVPAVGSAGGLLTLWKSSAITVEEVMKGDRFICISAKVNHNETMCIIGNIYGPNLEEERTSFFNSLGEVLINRRGCCVLGGTLM